ncbi:hypothetical protein KKC52_12435 [bacterium]|nr:hypothetical protein [bacterium]
MPLIDVVNFNSDGSCLSSAKWLKCLEGGRESLFMQMLKNYVCFGRKVNIGLVGTTIKDIAFFNPEAIDYINGHQEVFQIVLRPFTHDSPLLRLPEGFRYNLKKGLSCIHRYFTNVNDFYLAPEIMVTGEQLLILKELDICGVFIHKGRYDLSVSRHIPSAPFVLHGVLNTKMLCIPFTAKELENKRLSVLHGTTDSLTWCREVQKRSSSNFFTWRDGESCLLLPLGIEHEKVIFESELITGVERQFLSETSFNIDKENNTLRYFPLHSMKPWLNEMKLYWFISRVRDIEKMISSLPDNHKLFWLLTINSDILSSAEKCSPIVKVGKKVFQVDSSNFLWEGVISMREKKQIILARSERAGEGEDYLAYLDLLLENKMSIEKICDVWRTSHEPCLKKAYARIYDELQ